MKIDHQPDDHVSERVQGPQNEEWRNSIRDMATPFGGRTAGRVVIRQKMSVLTSAFASTWCVPRAHQIKWLAAANAFWPAES